MATTTNFGWETPDDTDLVKDGASAIRTLGSAIDTSLVDLKGGTTGQVLAKNSNTDMDFTWSAPSSNKVVQIVNATYSTQATSSSSTFADTGLTATITPTSASNKILVFVNQSGCAKYTNNTQMQLALNRGTTQLIQIEGFAAHNGSSAANYIGSISATYLDSPATTSATTYKTRFASEANLATVVVQDSSGSGATSTITLMEVTP